MASAAIEFRERVYNLWHRVNLPVPLLYEQGLSLYGISVGSGKSGFYIPELKLMLDAGIQSMYSPSYIFVTHCHSDHASALPMLLTGIASHPSVYVPKASLSLFSDFLDSSFRLFKNEPAFKNPFQLVGVVEHEIVKLEKSGYQIQMYQLYHDAPAMGYGLQRETRQLKKEYYGLPPFELKSLREKGIEITEPMLHYYLVYLTDTNVSVFNNQAIFNYPVIMIECTFLSADAAPDAKEHIRWPELEPFVKTHPECLFALIHFSIRYNTQDLKSFQTEVNKLYSNVFCVY